MSIFSIYVIAYTIMLFLSSIHVLFNWKVLNYQGYENIDDLLKKGPRVESYKRTIPWQPLYNLVVFTLLSYFYIIDFSILNLVYTSFIWIVLSIVIDVVLWILIPHPWKLSTKELFIGHQPWLFLCYLCTAISPFIAYFLK